MKYRPSRIQSNCLCSRGGDGGGGGEGQKHPIGTSRKRRLLGGKTTKTRVFYGRKNISPRKKANRGIFPQNPIFSLRHKLLTFTIYNNCQPCPEDRFSPPKWPTNPHTGTRKWSKRVQGGYFQYFFTRKGFMIHEHGFSTREQG